MCAERQRVAYPQPPVQLPEGSGRLTCDARGSRYPALGKKIPSQREREERLRLEGTLLDRPVIFLFTQDLGLRQAPGTDQQRAADDQMKIGPKWEWRPREMEVGGQASLAGFDPCGELPGRFHRGACRETGRDQGPARDPVEQRHDERDGGTIAS